VTQAGPSDETLVAALARGERLAFSLLYKRHAASVLKFAFRLVGTDGLSEDILQETFLTLWSKRTSVRLVGDSVLPWLLVTCRNHSSNAVRKLARRRTEPLPDDIPSPMDAAADTDWLRAEWAQLSPIDRRVCELCLVDGLSYAQAAAQLNITTSAVAKRMQRSRARLREASVDRAQ